MIEIKEAIREFILSRYLPGESRENLSYETPLQTGGILDSLATMELVSFVGREFGVELDVYDTSSEAFDRIEDVARVIHRKQTLRRQRPGEGRR